MNIEQIVKVVFFLMHLFSKSFCYKEIYLIIVYEYIFQLAALSDYDEVLREDRETNRKLFIHFKIDINKIIHLKNRFKLIFSFINKY